MQVQCTNTMATNKHATIRYRALDKCFSNSGKRYYIEDLLEACNKALFEYDYKTDGIKKRQLYEDIKFMISSQGYSAPIIKEKDGRRAFYKYEDSNFSINKQPINENEIAELKSAMLLLNRFKGMPQFEWVNEVLPKIDQSFKLSNQEQEIISFQSNEFLKGMEFISPLFKFIQNKQTLKITYQSFNSDTATIAIFHPYYLKQYNNRWFLIGKHNDYNNLTNYALDRIQKIEEASNKYDDSQIVDFDEYFDDFIGVSKNTDKELIKITLKATKSLAPYIKTKPLHGSQKSILDNDNGFTFSIEVIPNFEFYKLIQSFGEDLIVLEPTDIKLIIKNKLKLNLKNYD